MTENNLIKKLLNHPIIFTYFSKYMGCFDIKNIALYISKDITKSINNIKFDEYYLQTKNCHVFKKKIDCAPTRRDVYKNLVRNATKENHLVCLDTLLKSKSADFFKHKSNNCCLVSRFGKMRCRCENYLFFRTFKHRDMSKKAIRVFIDNGFNNNMLLLLKGVLKYDLESIRIIIKNIKEDDFFLLAIIKKEVIMAALIKQDINLITIFDNEYYSIHKKKSNIAFKDIIKYLISIRQRKLGIKITKEFVDTIFDTYYDEYLLRLKEKNYIYFNNIEAIIKFSYRNEKFSDDMALSIPVIEHFKKRIDEFKKLNNDYYRQFFRMIIASKKNNTSII
jgi:hypothetical protein